VHNPRRETLFKAIKSVLLMELLKPSNLQLFPRLWTTWPRNWLSLSKNVASLLWSKWLKKKEESVKLVNLVDVKESLFFVKEKMYSIKS